jgi:hypothetical protein
VGPEKSRKKGWVRVVSWREGYVVVEAGADPVPFSKGDIAADIRTPQISQFGNYQFSYGNLWLPLDDLDETVEQARQKEEREVKEAKLGNLKQRQSRLFTALTNSASFQGKTEKGTDFTIQIRTFDQGSGQFVGILEWKDSKIRVAGTLTEEQMQFRQVEHLSGSGYAIKYAFAGRWNPQTDQVTGNYNGSIGFDGPEVTKDSPTFTMRLISSDKDGQAKETFKEEDHEPQTAQQEQSDANRKAIEDEVARMQRTNAEEQARWDKKYKIDRR